MNGNHIENHFNEFAYLKFYFDADSVMTVIKKLLRKASLEM